MRNYRVFAFTLLMAVSTFAQSNPNDPLDPMYLPSIDMNPADYPSNVWVTSSLAKVHQESATPGDVKWTLVSTARNEFESFQVHEQAGSSAISLNVSVSDLVNARTGTHISSAKNIIIYREAYMKIVTPSDANGTTGYIPDILIPTVDPYRRQARNAFPFTIAAGQTQSIWFDIFVPSTAPSGYYQGTVTVTNGGSTYATLPVLLSVWNFTLPSTSTLGSLYGSPDDPCPGYYSNGYSGCANYPGAGGDPGQGLSLSEVDISVMELDHRVSNAQAEYMNSPLTNPPNTWTIYDQNYGPLLSGTPTLSTNTILSGASLNTMVYVSCIGCNANPANLRDWMNHFTAKGWSSKLLAWTMDEPAAGSWGAIISNGTTYHGTNPPYRVMVTSSIANATAGGGLSSVDIITPTVGQMEPQGASNQRASYNTWLAGKSGRQVWMYQSCNSHGSCVDGITGDSTNTWPSTMIDATPVRNRIMQWVEYMDNVTGDLYYDTIYCWGSPCQDGAGNSGTDPWTYIYYSGGNGDGTLIYPGTPAKIGGTTPIPLPSIRLKNIRDGMEDYEYLKAVTNAGFGAFAMSEVQSFITNAYTFNNDPAAMLAARAALGNKLHQLSLTTPPEPPPTVSIIQIK
jgi:hypothetical protein